MKEHLNTKGTKVTKVKSLPLVSVVSVVFNLSSCRNATRGALAAQACTAVKRAAGSVTCGAR